MHLAPALRAALILASLSLASCGEEPASPDVDAQRAQAPSAPDTTTAPPVPSQPDPLVLGPDGLGDLRLGAPVPAGSAWAAGGAQASDTCLLYNSPDWPGAYAIVENGKVQRITLMRDAKARLASGIAVGADEAQVLKAYPGLREDLHAYVEPPAKYLTAPDAKDGKPALRFEIGTNRKVQQIHLGLWPVLGYVEACS